MPLEAKWDAGGRGMPVKEGGLASAGAWGRVHAGPSCVAHEVLGGEKKHEAHEGRYYGRSTVRLR
jgi:hypothetical protein